MKPRTHCQIWLLHWLSIPQERLLLHTQDYQSLCDKLREISTLGGIGGLLQWDESVMMPAGAAESRGKQKSVLAGVVYEKVGRWTSSSLPASPSTLQCTQLNACSRCIWHTPSGLMGCHHLDLEINLVGN